ncbi:MAG: radical SAM protein, partial [Myxococcota bacterium]|nr:radical SAM protein [Myxococcota bacterium]
GAAYRDGESRRPGRTAGQQDLVDPTLMAILQPLQHPCAGRIWVADIDQRGEAECVFCVTRSERVGPAPSAHPAATMVSRLRRDLRRFGGRKGWVWLSPWADPFVTSSRDLAGPALQVAEELLRSGQAITLQTRGGASTGAGLITLARRHPGRVRVALGFFSVDPEHLSTWERGAASLEDRIALAVALREAGAEVLATIGPIIPLVNDSQLALTALGKILRRAQIHVWNPSWIRYAPGLIPQVRREISRSRARMLQGWFHMGRTSANAVPELPERVRRTILGRLHQAADQQGAQLTVCRCTSSVGRGQCLDGPHGHAQDEGQMDLFG